MYHIKRDRRSQSSASEIVRGLQECLQTKMLKSITVSDIHRATGISRATFYRLFDTPEDVLHYQLDQMLVQSIENYRENWRMEPEMLLEETIALGMRHHVFLKALVDNGRFDLLYHYTEETFRILDFRMAISPENLSPVEREYILSHLSMAMVTTLITWEKNGRRETAADMVKYLKSYVNVLSGLV